MSDVFREVNEDLRREQLNRLWKRYRYYVIGVAVLIVIIVAGYQILQASQRAQAEDAGDRYQAAADLYLAGNLEEAEAAFVAIAEDGYGGYPALAMLAVGNIRAELGDITGAVTAFDTVAGDGGVEPAIRDVAHIRAAYLLSDTATPDQLSDRLATFLEEGNPYRALALEALALAAINNEEYDRAMGWVINMAEDTFATQAISSRANILFTYIRARQIELAPTPEEAPAPAADPFAGAAPAAPGVDLFAPAAGGDNAAPAPALDPLAAPQFQLPGGLPIVPGFGAPAETPPAEAETPPAEGETPPAEGEAAEPAPAAE